MWVLTFAHLNFYLVFYSRFYFNDFVINKTENSKIDNNNNNNNAFKDFTVQCLLGINDIFVFSNLKKRRFSSIDIF